MTRSQTRLLRLQRKERNNQKDGYYYEENIEENIGVSALRGGVA